VLTTAERRIASAPFEGENVVTDHAINRRVLMQAAAFSPALAAVAASRASAADSADALVVIAELVAKPGRADVLREILGAVHHRRPA